MGGPIVVAAAKGRVACAVILGLGWLDNPACTSSLWTGLGARDAAGHQRASRARSKRNGDVVVEVAGVMR